MQDFQKFDDMTTEVLSVSLREGIKFVDGELEKYPNDNFLLWVKALLLVSQEKYHDAAHWAVRATVEPNAHFHIFAIAAACLELDERHEEAGRYARLALEKHPGYSRKVFFQSFPYKLAHHRQRIYDALGRAGLI